MELRNEGSSGHAVNGTLITKAGPVPFNYMPQSGRASVEVPQDVHVHRRTLTAEEARSIGFPEVAYEKMINEPPFVSLVSGVTFALVQLPSEDVLSAMAPGLKPWTDYEGLDSHWTPEGSLVGFFFYVKNGQTDDGTTKLRTRMVLGSLEDSATGAASSALAGYLALRDCDESGSGSKDGVHKYEMVQGVEMGRRSTIGVEVSVETGRITRLLLIGTAVDVMEGTLAI